MKRRWKPSFVAAYLRHVLVGVIHVITSPGLWVIGLAVGGVAGLIGLAIRAWFDLHGTGGELVAFIVLVTGLSAATYFGILILIGAIFLTRERCCTRDGLRMQTRRQRVRRQAGRLHAAITHLERRR